MIIKHTSRHGHMGLTGENGEWLKSLIIGDDVLTTDNRKSGYDAMICWWEFTDEFLEFKGPKIFYCCEPSFYFRGWRSSKRELRKRLHSLRADEFAWHYHENPEMRVEHETSDFSDKKQISDLNRVRNAATVVSNLGHPLTRSVGKQKRVQFIVQSRCDIFGSTRAWNNFRLTLFSKPNFPKNYKGECPVGGKRWSLSNYHACICFENSSEPEYFTEKFPDAVRAGCVPIYHPHPIVREKFLNGAVWVDPMDYGLDPVATVKAALELDREQVAAQNAKWLRENPNLQLTKVESIYSKMVDILRKKISGEISLPQKASRANLVDEYFQHSKVIP